GDVARPDGRLSPAPGYLWRHARAAVASGPPRRIPARETWLGDGPVGRRRHGWPDPRPDPRGLADRELQLALGFLYQPPGRHPHLHRPFRLPASQRAAKGTLLRLVWLPHARRGHWRIPDDARSGRATGVVRFT